MNNTVRSALVLCLSTAVALTGCSATDDIDATQLTIVTTDASLDHAVALAVGEYLADQDIDVAFEQHHEPDDVFATLEAEADTAPDHARIGVVTAHQDPTLDENPLRVPDSLEILSQAPAELGLVPATSTVTAARFGLHQDDDAEQPVAPACDQQTWLHAHTPEHEIATTTAALADQGCQPAFEAAALTDSEAYVALAHQLTTQQDTVALVYGIDPMIPDRGLTTLDVNTDQWPHSNVIAVAAPALEDPLTEDIVAVLEVLDSEAATDLLRGYHNAQVSSSDLAYDVDHAMRYWLAAYGLVDQDTVTNVSTEND